MALLIPVAIVLGDVKNIWRYLQVLAGLGLAIALYHNLLYYGVIPEALSQCREGISCTSRQIEWAGFITIPLMSGISFLGINLYLIFGKGRE